jgi:hypothetical protein
MHDRALVQDDVLGKPAVRGHAEAVELVLRTRRPAHPVWMAGRADAIAEFRPRDVLSDRDHFARAVEQRPVLSRSTPTTCHLSASSRGAMAKAMPDPVPVTSAVRAAAMVRVSDQVRFPRDRARR